MIPPLTAEQLRGRKDRVFLVLTIVIGVLAGLAAVLFTVAIGCGRAEGCCRS